MAVAGIAILFTALRARPGEYLLRESGVITSRKTDNGVAARILAGAAVRAEEKVDAPLADADDVGLCSSLATPGTGCSHARPGFFYGLC